MSVAVPWVLWGTLAAVGGVVLAHLLSVRQPRALRLPTARFIPDRAVRAVSRASSPRDVLLLLVRVLLLLCIGVALAGVSWTGARVPVRTLIAVEGRALSHGDSTALADVLQRAASEYAPVSAIVVGDTVVDVTDPSRVLALMDSVLRVPRTTAPSTLAATLLRARRAAPRLADGADSVRFVLVSLERADLTTAALDPIRATWPGTIVRRAIPRKTTRQDSTTDPLQIAVRAAGDDVVSAAVAQWPDMASHRTFVIRDSMTPSDSAAAQAGAAIVVWTSDRVPPRWIALSDSVETQVSAVIAGGRALVAPLVRTARAPDNAHALLWWPDGSAAATEEALGRGCVRWVGFAAPNGDALLSADAQVVLSALSRECGTAVGMAAAPALDPALLSRMTGAGALASRASLGVSPPPALSPFTPWLLLAALVLLVVETALRSRRDRDRAEAPARAPHDVGERAANPEVAA